MTHRDVLLGSLSMDLYRVALAAHRGSESTCQRFLQETSRWISELNELDLEAPLRYIIDKTKQLPNRLIDGDLAEHALVYSIVLKNQVIKNSQDLI